MRTLSDLFHLQPGIMFIIKGNWDWYYIEFPLLTSLKLSVFRLNFGPYYSINFHSSTNIHRGGNDYGLSLGSGFFYINATMIQDIFPQKFRNEFIPEPINKNSIVFFFKDNNVLCKNNNEIDYPRYEDVESVNMEYIFLFKIDSIIFFLAKQPENIELLDGFVFASINTLRTALPKYLAFAGLTAYHLHCWYKDNKFCGKCGGIFNHGEKERILFCEKCQNQIYPKISPAIIVAIIDGNKLLMTKSACGYHKDYSLVAGFIEIGETAEEAVKREVMEEVGVKVKNIRYYKSQPWGFSGSLLLGYTAELDGNSDICLDKNELLEALWVEREQIQVELNNLSLTNEMIWNFKNIKESPPTPSTPQ